MQCVTHRGVAWGHAIWWALLKLLNILAQPVGVRVTAAGWVGEAGWTGRAEDGGNRLFLCRRGGLPPLQAL